MKVNRKNEKRLEGKVIVYSRFVSGGDDGPEKGIPQGQIFACLATTDLLNVGERFGLGEEATENLEEKIKRHIENFAEDIARQTGCQELKEKISQRTIPVIVGILPKDLEEVDIITGPEDIIFMGGYSSPKRCIRSLKVGVEYYFLQFEEQEFSKIEYKNNVEIEESKAKYQDISRREIENYIITNYVVPMLDALRRGEKREFLAIQSQFIDFSQGSVIARDAIELCNAIRNSKSRPNSKLLETYVRKIGAIKREDYEEAAQRRDEIRQIESA